MSSMHALHLVRKDQNGGVLHYFNLPNLSLLKTVLYSRLDAHCARLHSWQLPFRKVTFSMIEGHDLHLKEN